MNQAYVRDLDLNLLRVLVVVVEEGSLTRAASRLYVTQPAISAALARLRLVAGEPLFVRQGRSLALTARGRAMFEAAKPSLRALTESVTHSAAFVPAGSDRIFRLGLSDDGEGWLLPKLLARLQREAPKVRLVVLPVQFRTVVDALVTKRIDLAATVADDTPSSLARESVHPGQKFVCLFDPRHAKLGRRPSLARYLAHPHVVVSFNGDLRGYVEDSLGIERRVACSVPGFANVGAIVAGTSLVATLPERIARHLESMHPTLRHAPLPFELEVYPLEMIWRKSDEHDAGHRWLRDRVKAIAAAKR